MNIFPFRLGDESQRRRRREIKKRKRRKRKKEKEEEKENEWLNGIKSLYVNSLVCARIKGSESECFKIKSGVIQECIMSHWLFKLYMDTVMKVEMGMGRRGVSGDCLPLICI